VSVILRSFFTTATLPERDRFEAWRALLAAHDLDAEPHGFSADIETAHLGPMLLHVMNAAPQRTGRSLSRIRQDTQERFTLLLSQYPYRIETEHNVLDVPSNAVSVNDLSQPYRRSRSPETASLILSLARERVASVVPDEDALHGLVLSGAAGRLFAEHVRGLAVQRHTILAAEAPDLAQATLHILAACARPSPDNLARASAPLAVARLRKAKRFIRGHLATPLKIDQIAVAVGLSRSQLYRLFEAEDGVARYLRQQRLAAVRAALANAQDPRSITEIGAAYGFTNATHLSRAFREAYGQSLRDYRRTRAHSSKKIRTDETTVGDWLRSLG